MAMKEVFSPTKRSPAAATRAPPTERDRIERCMVGTRIVWDSDWMD